MSTTTPVVPFKKPRKVDAVKRMAAGRLGDCYAYAFNEALRYIDAGEPAPPLVVVHGTVRGAQGPIEHAWIERGGYAYDWQMFAVNGGAPVLLADFYRAREPRDVARYEATEAALAAAKHNHHGPWPTLAPSTDSPLHPLATGRPSTSPPTLA